MNTAKLAAAFRLVDPATEAAELAARGLIPAEVAAARSWRDPIMALISVDDLREAEVEIDDVAEAIRFYTATEPEISAHERLGGKPWFSYVGGGRPGFLVIADGYRKGPAGP